MRKIISRDKAKLVSDSACQTRPLSWSRGHFGAPSGCAPPEHLASYTPYTAPRCCCSVAALRLGGKPTTSQVWYAPHRKDRKVKYATQKKYLCPASRLGHFLLGKCYLVTRR